MRAVWSFWSKPYYAGQGRTWREPHHHLLAWGLSLRLARQHYPDTALITDKAGKALLVDKLGLEFAHVSTDLEALSDADKGLWALGKIYAYSLQDRPFVHIDADVFLWKPLPPSLTSAPVLAQCPEFHPRSGSPQIESAFARHSLALPVEWEWYRSRGESAYREENCGIVGGQKFEFLRHFAQSSLKVALDPANAPAWRELPDKDGYNFIVEQFLLSTCIDYHRSHPESPHRGVHVKYLFRSLEDAFNPTRAAEAGFTHLLGGSKSDLAVTRRLERRVQSMDPGFYQHCLRVGRHMGSA